MNRALAVLRPEPGNAATAARIEARGLTAIRLPLFEVRALAWEAPDPDRFQALLLTSANAVRHAGAELARYRRLPVFAVGGATAAAALSAGLQVAVAGTGGVGDLLSDLDRLDVHRLLHLTGRERAADLTGAGVESVAVYASEPLAPVDLAPLAGATALVHSPRAGARLATLAARQALDRAAVKLAAISPAALAAAGAGWQATASADLPTDERLIAAAVLLGD